MTTNQAKQVKSQRKDAMSHYFASWDTHPHCRSCMLRITGRVCSRTTPCSWCIDWPEAYWRQLDASISRSIARRERKAKSSVSGPSGHAGVVVPVARPRSTDFCVDGLVPERPVDRPTPSQQNNASTKDNRSAPSQSVAVPVANIDPSVLASIVAQVISAVSPGITKLPVASNVGGAVQDRTRVEAPASAPAAPASVIWSDTLSDNAAFERHRAEAIVSVPAVGSVVVPTPDPFEFDMNQQIKIINNGF